MNNSLRIGPGTLIATTQEPLSIYNELTGEAHGYAKVADALKGNTVFEFDYWPPGVYRVRNYADADLPVLLFNVTYNVQPGSEWRFVAHYEIGPPSGYDVAGSQTRIIQSIWDGGTSIWDGGSSVWDDYIPA